jgi:hypothetical protein
MIKARGYGDDPGLDYLQLVDSDVFEDGAIVPADWWARTRYGRTIGRRAGQLPSAVPAAGGADAPRSRCEKRNSTISVAGMDSTGKVVMESILENEGGDHS